MSQPPTNSDVEARAAIAQLIDDYGEALDRRRWDFLAELFIPEATADWQVLVHRSHSGRDAIVDYVRTTFDRFGRTHHQFSNYRGAMTEMGARGSCRARNYHALAGDGVNEYLETLGEFRIDAVRTSHGWQIAHIELEAFDVVHGVRDQRAGAASGSSR